MSLTIQFRHAFKSTTANEVTCELGGKLDSATAPELSRGLMPVLNGKPTLLIFDLAKLQFVTSMGIRLFFAAQKKQKEHGGKVSFVNLSPQIKEVFQIMGSLPDVQIFKDTAELDAYLLARQQK
jgi:anti-sigma B factor antagonist